jgi:hypothetical protein
MSRVKTAASPFMALAIVFIGLPARVRARVIAATFPRTHARGRNAFAEQFNVGWTGTDGSIR